MFDQEDNTTDERTPKTSTDIGAQNMPSANAFADMFAKNSQRISQRPISRGNLFAPNIPEITMVISTLGYQHMARASQDSSLILEENPLIFYAKAASQ